MYSLSTDPSIPRRRIKKRKRNLVAAVLEIVVIATLATSLAQPHWFHLVGGGCSRSYLGAFQFFYIGYFETKDVTSSSIPSTSLLYHGNAETLTDCVTPQIVTLFRVTIALTFLAIISSFFQFIFDVLGASRKIMKTLQRNAIGSIITVVLCVCIIGSCYYMSMLMEHQQKSKRIRDGAKVMIQFHISYYLVTGAGAIAVIAAATNLIRRYPTSVSSSSRHSRHNPRRMLPSHHDENALMDDYDGQETFSVQHNSLYDPVLSPPYPHWSVGDSSQIHNSAPPPYTP